MAKAQPPVKRSLKGEPPAPQTAPANLNRQPEDDMVLINFKVPAGFRREFKGFANEHDMSMTELLKQAFSTYKEIKK